MNSNRGSYIQDKRYRSNRKRSRMPRGPLSIVALLLITATVIVAAVKYGPDWLKPETQNTSESSAQPSGTSRPSSEQTTATTQPPAPPTPTPVPTSWNPSLMPFESLTALRPSTVAEGLSPSEKGMQTAIFDNSFNKLSDYERSYPIALGHPLDYQQIPGVLTFRGNNFRSAPAFGQVELTEKTMTQNWEKGIGSLPSSSWSFSWTGTGWTGQPLLVQWDDSVRKIMNINPDKKDKEDLVEVIYATLDGNIYFLDLDDGKPTRSPITIGAPITGTPCIDSRGYPVLYVGQGDKNKNVTGIGFRVYNLIDQSLLLYQDCSQDPAHRTNWAACDSSPLFDAAADTLIYPNENGMVYTMRMNTRFDAETATLTIDPERITYRYTMSGLNLYGIESSMAVYDHFGYYSDNSGIFNCIDLNSMKPVWSRQLEDDSDVTPVLQHEGDRLAVYTGTEVDWQQDFVGVYQGNAFVYKLDAMTGEIIWESSVPCYTKNAADQGDDINGGVMGSPIIGKQNLDDRVIFSFCMTNGVYSGNSIVAFDQMDGSILWEYKMTQYSWSSPVDIYDADGNGYIIIPDSQSQLHLIDGQTGELLDILELVRGEEQLNAGNIESSCAVFGNKLVIGTRGNIITGVTLH